MNKEEIKFYSIGRGSLNLDGKFYYGLDYAITDFMRNLEQENNQLKEQRQELRSWLEDYVEVLTKQDETVEGLDYLEGQMLLDYQSVLSKLNELEGGKNENTV